MNRLGQPRTRSNGFGRRERLVDRPISRCGLFETARGAGEAAGRASGLVRAGRYPMTGPGPPTEDAHASTRRRGRPRARPVSRARGPLSRTEKQVVEQTSVTSQDTSAALGELARRVRAMLLATGDRVPPVVVVRVDIGDPLSDVAAAAEAAAFHAEWWSDLEPGEYDVMHQAAYAAYGSSSRFLLAIDPWGCDDEACVVGVVRLGGGAAGPLKTLDDIEEVWGVSRADLLDDLCRPRWSWHDLRIAGCFSAPSTWDISSLVVSGQCRNDERRLYAVLTHAIHSWSSERGVRTWTAVLVRRFYDVYAEFLGTPLRAIAGLEMREHMRELSVPAVLQLAEIRAMLNHPTNRRAPRAFRQLVLGEGLDYETVDAADLADVEFGR